MLYWVAGLGTSKNDLWSDHFECRTLLARTANIAFPLGFLLWFGSFGGRLSLDANSYHSLSGQRFRVKSVHRATVCSDLMCSRGGGGVDQGWSKAYLTKFRRYIDTHNSSFFFDFFFFFFFFLSEPSSFRPNSARCLASSAKISANIYWKSSSSSLSAGC